MAGLGLGKSRGQESLLNLSPALRKTNNMASVFSDSSYGDKLVLVNMLETVDPQHCENCADFRQHIIDLYQAHFIKGNRRKTLFEQVNSPKVEVTLSPRRFPRPRKDIKEIVDSIGGRL